MHWSPVAFKLLDGQIKVKSKILTAELVEAAARDAANFSFKV